MAVLALVTAIPFERGRACGVCPADCPMHAARHGSRPLGCHHGGAAPAAATDDGACAMRSACGHQGGAVEVAFHAVLAPATSVRTVVVAIRSFAAAPRPYPAEAPAPLDPPPESVRV